MHFSRLTTALLLSASAVEVALAQITLDEANVQQLVAGGENGEIEDGQDASLVYGCSPSSLPPPRPSLAIDACVPHDADHPPGPRRTTSTSAPRIASKMGS